MYNQKKTILITGATGFLGNSIVSNLMSKYEFINVGRSENTFCKNIYWDLKNTLNIEHEINSKIAIHCASIVGSNSKIAVSDYLDINVKSTAALLDLCVKKNVDKFILISTGGVYGYNDKPMKESDRCNPEEIYSLSKYFSEKICELYKDKIQIIILRLFFPYGNYKSDRLINRLITNILNGKSVCLNHDGHPIVNPIHIVDLVNIIEIFLNSNSKGIFNVSGNEEISIENLCNLISIKAKITPSKYIYNNIILKNMIGNNDKLNMLINYKQQVSLSQGIDELVNFLKKV